MCFAGFSLIHCAQGAFAVAELSEHWREECRTISGLRVITITGERDELCEGRAINSWLQTSGGARSKNKRPSPATFSACYEVIRQQLLLRLYGVKIRLGHAGKWSTCCWGVLGPRAPELSPFLIPVMPLDLSLLTSTAALFSVPSSPDPAPLLHCLSYSCCFTGGQGRSFPVPAVLQGHGGEEASPPCVHRWGAKDVGWDPGASTAPAPIQMAGVLSCAEGKQKPAVDLRLQVLDLNHHGHGLRPGSPAPEVKLPNYRPQGTLAHSHDAWKIPLLANSRDQWQSVLSRNL